VKGSGEARPLLTYQLWTHEPSKFVIYYQDEPAAVPTNHHYRGPVAGGQQLGRLTPTGALTVPYSISMFSKAKDWMLEIQGRLLLQAALVLFLFLLHPCRNVAAGDDKNKIAFNTHCRMCHSTKPHDNRLGPTMYGIFGAEAGQVEGYGGYSGGLKGLVWDQVTLDRFIADPQSVSPNTNMIYPPVRDAEERKKIIEFLKSGKSGKV